MSIKDLDELLKPQETAQALNISVRTLPRWEAAGLLYPVRLSSP
jgi:DNA-binding transcriptional MerR regulator